jgi:hypothetical protein
MEKFERAKEFLKKMGPSYGLGTSIEALDDAGRETLKEIYKSDANWNSKGEILVHPPKSLLAGRMVFELR